MKKKNSAGVADSPSAAWMDRLHLCVTWMDRVSRNLLHNSWGYFCEVWLMCFFATYWFSSVPAHKDVQQHRVRRFHGYHMQESDLELIKAWHIDDF